MGCDIHLYIEYSKKEQETPKEIRWSDFGGRINPGRSYLMFGILSRVVRRANPTFSFEPKGVPDDMAYAARCDSQIYICETPIENSVTLEKAKQWEGNGHKIINNHEGKPTWIKHPDWHSHSWLTTAEYEKALDFYNSHATPKWVEPEYEAVLSTMKRFEELGFNARIVFWFDN